MNSESIENLTHELAAEEDSPPLERGGRSRTLFALRDSIRRPLATSLAFVFLVFPLTMGGVHARVYLPVYTFLFFLFLAIAIFNPKTLVGASRWGNRQSFLPLLLLAIGYVIFYSILQYLFFSWQEIEHPVLSSAGALAQNGEFWASLRAWCLAAVFLLLCSALLWTKARSGELLWNLFAASGVIVAMVGLMHWFYDTGLLFWTFEPEQVFVSQRARWPFVNSNHLAHFLLPVFFILLARLIGEASKFLRYVREHYDRQRRQRRALSFFAGDRKMHTATIYFAFSFVGVITVLIAITATLSRSSWLGLGAGILLFLLLEGRVSRTQSEDAEEAPLPAPGAMPEPENVVDYDELARRRASRRRRRRKDTGELSILSLFSWGQKLARPMLVLVALFVFYVFLNDRGVELVEKRLEYSLLYAKDDMRWQMYSDTTGMIAEHWLFGVGLSSWEQNYFQYMDPRMAGLNPVYLHSDLLQFLAEAGLAGTLPFLIIILLTLPFLWRALSRREVDYSLRLRVAALCAGFFAFLFGAAFDFPFRIPAISLFIIGLLALTAFYVEIILTSGNKIRPQS